MLGSARDDLLRTAEPILRRHAEALAGDIIRVLIADPDVRRTAKQSVVEDVLANPRVQQMLRDAINDLLTGNPEVRAELQRFALDPRLRLALFDLAAEDGPKLARLALLMVLDDRQAEIHPAFAILIHSKILNNNHP